jgi:hypothetical protein
MPLAVISSRTGESFRTHVAIAPNSLFRTLDIGRVVTAAPDVPFGVRDELEWSEDLIRALGIATSVDAGIMPRMPPLPMDRIHFARFEVPFRLPVSITPERLSALLVR